MSDNTSLAHEPENDGPMDRAKLERELGKFGAAFGKGQNSRPSAALMAVDAASRCKDVGKDDANDLYTKFAQGAAKCQGIEYSVSASHKVQVSKFKRFLELGQLPAIDGVDMMNRTSDEIVRLSRMAESPLRGSAYDNMVLAARRQIENPTKALTTDEITAILSEQTPEKTSMDRVIGAYKAAHRLIEKLLEDGIDPAVLTAAELARENYAEQILAMGGDLPPVTKAEKELAKAQGVIKAHGGTASFAVAPTPVLNTDNFKIVGSLAG